MKILFSAQNYLNAIGGAEISAQTLLRKLAEKHDVQVVARGENGDYEWEGMKVHETDCNSRIPYINLRWQKQLDTLEFKPDLVITQINAAAPTVFWAKKKGIPLIFYVRSFEHFCIDGFGGRDVFGCGQRCYKCGSPIKWLRHPLLWLMYRRNRQALQKADMVICQTQFMADVVWHYSGRKAEVITNPMDLESFKIEKPGDSILFINPQPHKGIKLVAKLIERLKHRNFVFAGDVSSGYSSLCSKKNVRCLGRISDMKEAYRLAKVLLVPSDMADSSPRVVFEANYNGIPVITSDVGGAAEVGGDASIKLPREDVDAWADAIEKIYEDNDHYASISEASGAHAKEHTLDKALSQLDEVVQAKLGLKLF